jgi:hypothetical protein
LAGGLASLGQLELLASHAPAAVLGLLAGDGPYDASLQPPVRRREIVVASSDDASRIRLRSTRSMNASSSLGERCKRSLCQVTMASMLPDSTLPASARRPVEDEPVGAGVVVAEHLDGLPAPGQAVRFAVGPLAIDAARWPLGSEEIRV